ncbi:hypothetical protein [Streptomyces sp. NPDC090798]|uniref:hypothetical protein n=1 Tax=Streptomyces sp. NPDC090798 TaxID=3365968 RepID=UPI0038300DD8
MRIGPWSCSAASLLSGFPSWPRSGAHGPILRKMPGRGVRTAWEDRFAQPRRAAAA